MPSIGWPELLVVLVIALVIFGPKRLPDMGRQLGRGLREFRKATSEIQGHFDLDLTEKDEKKEAGENGSAAATTAVPPVEAARTAVPVDAAPSVESHDVVEGEVLREESDQPAHPIAG